MEIGAIGRGLHRLIIYKRPDTANIQTLKECVKYVTNTITHSYFIIACLIWQEKWEAYYDKQNV